MQRPLILSPLVLALSLHAGHAMALGFGKVSGSTALGHPLSFSVGLRLEPSESLEPGCIAADVTLGDRPLPADQVRARLVRIGASGERRIRVTTTVAIDEPTVSVTVRAGCPSQLTRNFMVFADPPQAMARVGDPEAEAADEQDVRSNSPLSSAAPSPEASASRPARMRPSARAAEPGPRRDVAEPPVAAAAPPVPRRGRAAAAPAAPTRAERPVLRLDPLEEEEMAQPLLRMSTALGTAPAASGAVAAVPDPETAQRLQDLERLRSLEAAVRQLRDNERGKAEALVALQARVDAAERQRYANPLTYALAALCVALAAGLVAALWLRRRDRQQAEWWAAAAAEAPAAGDAASEPPATVPPEPFVASVPVPRLDVPPAPPAPRPPAPSPRVDPPPPRQEYQAEVAEVEPRRPMSAEELIDLEQQVDFFVVLGQDDAAIDLLMSHVRSTSGVSPLPYLKLLEIYRRREEREPYERIRERFNRRFNAYAPEWGVDPEDGRDLAGYPDVLERVQGIWEMPSMAMELLDTLLFRRDAGPTFDVPAYRELLFLYGIARDLAERHLPSSGVDLLLPFGDDEAEPSISAVAALRLPEATEAPPSDLFKLDLDVSTDQPPDLRVEIPAPPADDDRLLDFHLDDRDLPPPRR